MVPVIVSGLESGRWLECGNIDSSLPWYFSCSVVSAHETCSLARPGAASFICFVAHVIRIYYVLFMMQLSFIIVVSDRSDVAVRVRRKMVYALYEEASSSRLCKPLHEEQRREMVGSC